MTDKIQFVKNNAFDLLPIAKKMKQNNKQTAFLNNIELASKIVLKEDEKLFKELGKENNKEIEEEIKSLMLFCRHNQEAKDRLNKISNLILSKEKEMLKDIFEVINEIPALETYCLDCEAGFDEDSDECFRCDGKNIIHKDLDISREELKERLQKLKGDKE